MNEFLVTISDNKNNGNYAKMIDLIRTKDAQRAYICVNKFQASVPTIVNTLPNNVAISINGSHSSFSNEPNSNVVVSSQIVDSFVTNSFIPSGNSYMAFYNVENNNQNWVEINRSSLSNLKFSFQTCSNYVDLINNIRYVDLPSFGFTIQLKVKYE